MNQQPTGLNVTEAITGFLQYKSAEGLSPVIVSGFDRDLKLWIKYQGIGSCRSGINTYPGVPELFAHGLCSTPHHKQKRKEAFSKNCLSPFPPAIS